MDFIVSPLVSNRKPLISEIRGQKIYIDDPIEIIAKKIHFRSEEFKPRDVFDLAAVYSARPVQLIQSSSTFCSHLDALQKRVHALEVSGELEKSLNALELASGGKRIRGKEIELCREFLASAERYLTRELEPQKRKPRRKH